MSLKRDALLLLLLVFCILSSAVSRIKFMQGQQFLGHGYFTRFSDFNTSLCILFLKFDEFILLGGFRLFALACFTS